MLSFDIFLRSAIIIGIVFSFVEMVNCAISPLWTKNLIAEPKQQ